MAVLPALLRARGQCIGRDEESKRFAAEFAEKPRARPDLRICVFGDDKPYYNVYADFHVDYFDDDFDDEFRRHVNALYEQGVPTLVVIDADEMDEVRSVQWLDAISRRTDRVNGEEIVILKSPPGRRGRPAEVRDRKRKD